MRRAGLGLLYLLFLLFLGEGTARLYWWITRGVPVLESGQILGGFYPELRRVGREETGAGDAHFDVLLLGGSALNRCCGAVEESLAAELGRRTPMAVRLHNLAKPAHNSRDSAIKYRHLEGRRFDLVLLYDGVNDVRANNCPPDVYRDDYSHYAWYRTVNALESRRESRFVLPFTLEFAAIAAADGLRLVRSLPVQQPRPEWVAYGAQLKTPAAFRANLEEILGAARRRGDPVLLATSAYYRAPGYSLEAFRAGRLDYGSDKYPIELWGAPDNVVAGIEAHNQVVRELARAHPEALFVDQDARIPKSGSCFDDLCHFTAEGSVQFARNVAEAVLARQLVPPR